MKKLLSVIGFILAFCAALFVIDSAYRFFCENCRKYILLNK